MIPVGDLGAFGHAEVHVISLPSVHCGTRKSHDRRCVMTNTTIRSAVVLPSDTG